MATRADFTDDEWRVLQLAVSDTMAWLTMADPGFWDMFKEAKGAATFISSVKVTSESPLVRQLADEMKMKRDKALSANPTDMASEVIARVGDAAAMVADKAPDDLPAFKEFIVGVARATAGAAGGVGSTEASAIAKLEAALG